MSATQELTFKSRLELATDLMNLMEKYKIDEKSFLMNVKMIFGEVGSESGNSGQERNTGRKKPAPNTGKKWTGEDEQKMIEEFKKGTSGTSIGSLLGRTEKAVVAHLADYCKTNKTGIDALEIKLPEGELVIFNQYMGGKK